MEVIPEHCTSARASAVVVREATRNSLAVGCRETSARATKGSQQARDRRNTKRGRRRDEPIG